MDIFCFLAIYSLRERQDELTGQPEVLLISAYQDKDTHTHKVQEIALETAVKGTVYQKEKFVILNLNDSLPQNTNIGLRLNEMSHLLCSTEGRLIYRFGIK